MKFQFFIKDAAEYKRLDDVYDACNSGILEEIVCTSGLIGEIVDEIPRDKTIAIIDYPHGHSSFYARENDVKYCIQMGIKQIEVPIRADYIINGDSQFIADEFNHLYEFAAKKHAIIKPIIEYRFILNNTNHNYFSDLLYFLQEQVGMDALSINTGYIADYFEENLKLCADLSERKIQPTTFRELYNDSEIQKFEKHAYRVRFSSIRSLNLIK